MKEKNIDKKRGISLIVLIITIAVMLILLSVIVVSINSSMDNAKLSAFATDLSTVEDLTKTYYMQNNSFPTQNSEEDAVSEETILSIVGSDNKEAFIQELKSNNDYTEDVGLGAFYEIDLSKLDVDSSKRGTKKDGEQSDVYVVCASSMNIYYLKGIKVKKDTYFSLSSKITNRVKINQDMTNQDNSSVSIQTTDGLTIKKITKGWSNNIGIYVQANMQDGQSLHLQATGVDKKQLVTNTGNNEFNFNDLSEITGFTTEDSQNFKNSEQVSKKLVFVKQEGTQEIGKIEVDMSNYETDAPEFTQIDATKIGYYDEYNMIPLKVSDATSGVKEVRYEYLTKYDDKGIVQNYYSGVTQYDTTYLRARGKKAVADKDGNVVLKVNKDIQGVQIVVVDNAGNVNTNFATVGLYENNNIYIGANIKQNIENMLSYSIVLVNNNGISNVQVQTSSDGISYSNPAIIAVNSTSTDKIKIIDDKKENQGTIAYLKITATDNSSSTRITNTRVFKIDGKDKLEIGKVLDESKTFNLKTVGTYYNPLIPKGFAPVDVGAAKWGSADGFNNGLVIQDANSNQFVWVPVESVDENDFSNRFVTYPWNDSQDNFANYTEEETEEIASMKESVRKNGGFYIARYEASIPEGGNVSTVNGTQSPLSKSGLDVWNSVSSSSAILIARSMYPNLAKLEDYGMPATLENNTGVVSTIVYGRQWDQALRFISKDYATYPTQSLNYGNYSNSQGSTSVLTKTGSNSNYALKNIYDMAGNVFEYTMEIFNGTSNHVYRGGAYNTSNENFSAASRAYSTTANFSDVNLGFRVALYINN